MAVIINVAGLATIKLDTGTSNALETLGYTQNGAEAALNGYFLPVHTDENGGDEGPETDIQFLGETARITLFMPKYDPAVKDKMSMRMYGGTAGVVGPCGSLMIGGLYTTRLVIASPIRPLNFPLCVFREPMEINKGTKFSLWRFSAMAHRNSSGVLWNRTVV